MPNQVETRTPSTEAVAQPELARRSYSRPTVESLDLDATHGKFTPAPETVGTPTGS